MAEGNSGGSFTKTVFTSAVVASLLTFILNFSFLEWRKAQIDITKELIQERIEALRSLKNNLDLFTSQFLVVKTSFQAYSAKVRGAPSRQEIKDYIGTLAITASDLRTKAHALEMDSPIRRGAGGIIDGLGSKLFKAQNQDSGARELISDFESTVAPKISPLQRVIESEIRRLASTLSIEEIQGAHEIGLPKLTPNEFLVNNLIAMALGVLASLLVTKYYDWATSPLLRVQEDSDAPATGKRADAMGRHQFFQVAVWNVPATWPFQTRKPAWNCRATLVVFDKEGKRPFPGIVAARWSGSLQPFRTQLIDGSVAQVPDSSLIPTGQRFDVHPNSCEKLGIALKYEGEVDCWIFSNESYFFDWKHPEWRLGVGEYFIMLQLHYERNKQASQWLALRNLGPTFEDWTLSTVKSSPFSKPKT